MPGDNAQEVKFQHYVPQFYLRYFGNPLYCFDKKNGEVFKTSPRRICAEDYFYGKAEQGKPSIESTLCQEEGQANLAFQELMALQDFEKLQADNKEAIYRHVVRQEIRTNEFKKRIESLGKLWYKFGIENKLPLPSEEEVIEAPKRVQLEILDEETDFLFKHIRKLKPIIGINKTAYPFFTSDHPVNRYSLNEGDIGLVSLGVAIQFPISPTIMLSLCDSRVLKAEANSRIEVIDEECVTHANSLQVRDSTRFIISTTDEFSLVRRILADYPELKDPDRKRTEPG